MSGRLVQGTILSIVLALLLNGLVYWFGQSRGVSYLIQQPNSPSPEVVTYGMVIIVTVVTTLFGGLLLWLLSQFAARPLMIFLWAAAIVGLLSLIGPFGTALGVGSMTALGLMHIITAGTAALGLAIFFQQCENCT